MSMQSAVSRMIMGCDLDVKLVVDTETHYVHKAGLQNIHNDFSVQQ